MFERKTEELREKVNGETVEERAKQLAALRDKEGYMSQYVVEEGGPQILECHSPIMNLLEKYKCIGRLEQDMFEKAAQSAGATGRNLDFRPFRGRVLFRGLISIPDGF